MPFKKLALALLTLSFLTSTSMASVSSQCSNLASLCDCTYRLPEFAYRYPQNEANYKWSSETQYTVCVRQKLAHTDCDLDETLESAGCLPFPSEPSCVEVASNCDCIERLPGFTGYPWTSEMTYVNCVKREITKSGKVCNLDETLEGAGCLPFPSKPSCDEVASACDCTESLAGFTGYPWTNEMAYANCVKNKIYISQKYCDLDETIKSAGCLPLASQPSCAEVASACDCTYRFPKSAARYPQYEESYKWDNDEQFIRCVSSKLSAKRKYCDLDETVEASGCIASAAPTFEPSDAPTLSPTASPSSLPSDLPSLIPSSQPSSRPSLGPTSSPTSDPSSMPSDLPSIAPSSQPTSRPSLRPTSAPTSVPSAEPTSMGTLSDTTLQVALTNQDVGGDADSSNEPSTGTEQNGFLSSDVFSGAMIGGMIGCIAVLGAGMAAYGQNKKKASIEPDECSDVAVGPSDGVVQSN